MPTKKATKTTASKKSATAKKVLAQKKTETLTKSKIAKKPATSAAKKTASKTKPSTKTPTKKPAIVKKASAVKKPVTTQKPLPGSLNPGSGSASSVPKEIIDFLEEFDALKSGKTWAAKAAALINTIPAAMFDDFSDALDLATPLSSGKIPAQLLATRPTKPATKSGKGTITQIRPTLKTFGTAILGNKIGRDELSELVERLRCCICCCHCWPCRPWPFCRICCRRLIKVSSTQDTGWVYHLKFNNAAAAIANRVADITCPSGGSTGGPWAPKDWTTAAPADAPIGYAPASGSSNYAPSSGSTNYAPATGSPNYAPKNAGSPPALIKYSEIDAPVGQSVKFRDKATSPAPADVEVSLSSHDHNSLYPPKNSTGPAALIKYAEIDTPAGQSVKLRDKATSPAPADVEVSLASHNHSTLYAPISGSANYAPKTTGTPAVPIKYAEIDAPDTANKTVKLRDMGTSPAPTDVVVSLSDHKHAADYSPIGHNHDTAYSAIGHNHDADYAEIDHDHDADYAPISGSANYAAASHAHKMTQAGRLETPSSVAGGLVTVNLSNISASVLANIKVHATAYGKKTGAHFPMYITDITIGGTLAAPTVTFTIQHADGTAYNSGDLGTWGLNAKMILSFVASENL